MVMLSSLKISQEEKQMKKSVNVNDRVWVRLTRKGLRILRESRHDVPQRGPGRWRRFQLHDLMMIFGPHSYTQIGPLFVNNEVQFTEPPLRS